MKRALLFVIIFIGVIAGTYLLVIGTNFSALQTLRENRQGMLEGAELVQNITSLKGLTEFIAQHSEYVSITSYNVNNPDSGIFYQENVPRTLGTTANIFLLIEYEQQVQNGMLNPDAPVSLQNLEIFNLPEVHQNNHDAFLEAIDGEAATLDEIVANLIIHNDLPAADYLWFLLGEDNLSKLITDLGFSEKAMPLPFSGLYSAINPALSDTADNRNLNTDAFREKVINLAEKLISNEEYRAHVKEIFEENRLSLTFIQERDALSLFPKSTTNKMADLMAALVNGEVISKEVSQAVINKMQWPEKMDPLVNDSFEKYAALYENRMGLLGGIDFGTSVYDGHTSVQAVYFDSLPVAFWMHMSSSHMNKDFQQRLIWDPALFETTLNEINSSNE